MSPDELTKKINKALQDVYLPVLTPEQQRAFKAGIVFAVRVVLYDKCSLEDAFIGADVSFIGGNKGATIHQEKGAVHDEIPNVRAKPIKVEGI